MKTPSAESSCASHRGIASAILISMYCLESEAEMPALPEELEEARGEGISINNGWGPKRIVVEDGKVTGVEFKKCTAVFDADHKFNPQYDESNTITVPADYVLMRCRPGKSVPMSASSRKYHTKWMAR